MSDDYHRPTLTFPTGAYNATQVRLYGILPTDGISYPQIQDPIAVADGDFSIMVNPNPNALASDAEKIKDIVEKSKASGDSNSRIFQNLLNDSSIKSPFAYLQILKIDVKTYGTMAIMLVNTDGRSSGRQCASTPQASSCGIILGYAYEGHCYDLPKPKIMVLPSSPIEIPDDDCGYELKRNAQYKLWIVDKLDECVEFEMNQGFIEQIVLEANLPGKRAPNLYIGRMMLGHRSGRLTD